MTETDSNLSSLNGTDDPRRHVWTRPGVLAGVVIAVLIYGSLLPFDFAWATAAQQHGGRFAAIIGTLASPQWVHAQPGESSLGMSFAMSDLLMNFLLYVPLGVTLRMALRRKVRRCYADVVGAAAIAFLLSWTVESMQGLMPARIASINDVLANVVAALVGAVVAPWCWLLYRRAAFWLYCRVASLKSQIRAFVRKPATAIVIAVTNAFVIGLWYFSELTRSGVGDQPAVAMPFERAFALPYDLGAVVLGEAFLAYAGIGCLLLLLAYTGAERVAMGWVVLGVVVIAFAAEISRAATHHTAPDVTGPLLALSAAAFMSVTVYTFSYAVRRSNRRRQARSYHGPERRRVPHDYA